MNLNAFYNEVAKRADTGGTSITAAETRRVLSEAFQVLGSQDAAVATDIVAKGLAAAAKKAAAKKGPTKKAAKKKTTKKRKAAKKK